MVFFLSVHGAAYLFGRPPAMVQSNGIISENIPLKISPLSVGSPGGTKWVNGAAGRSHFLLVDSRGDVWGCGNNIVGQIGVVSDARLTGEKCKLRASLFTARCYGCGQVDQSRWAVG